MNLQAEIDRTRQLFRRAIKNPALPRSPLASMIVEPARFRSPVLHEPLPQKIAALSEGLSICDPASLVVKGTSARLPTLPADVLDNNNNLDVLRVEPLGPRPKGRKVGTL